MMRPTFSPPRIVTAVAVAFLTAIVAGMMLGARQRSECEAPSLEPTRPLQLDTAADQAHLDDDARRIVNAASAYRDDVARQPLQSASRDAIANHATRPARAYDYCTTILEELVAKAHGVGPATVKARVEAIAAARDSARRD